MNRTVLLLICRSFLKGAALIILEVAVTPLFLSQVSYSKLPSVYIGIAIFTIISGLLFRKFDKSTSYSKLISYTLFIMIFVTVIAIVPVLISINLLTVSILMIVKAFFWILVNIEFWSVAQAVLNIREGKKYFALVSSGEIAATIIIGTVLLLFLNNSSVFLLLLIVIVILLFYLISFIMIRTLNKPSFRDDTNAINDTAKVKRSLSKLLNNKFIIFYFFVAFISSLGFYLVDFLFLNQAQKFIADELILRRFFSLFFMILGLVNLVGTLFVSGKIIVRLGIKGIVILLPFAITLLTGASITALFCNLTFLLFILAVSSKGFDDVIRVNFEYPSQKIMLQIVPPNERFRLLAIQETLVEPIAIGLSGIILLLLSTKTYLVYILLLTIAGVWLSLAFLLRKQYTVFLISSYNKKRFDPDHLESYDPSILQIIDRGLNSKYPDEIVYAVNLAQSVCINKPGMIIKSKNLQDISVELWFENIIRQCIKSENKILVKFILEKIRTIKPNQIEKDLKDILSNPAFNNSPIISECAFILTSVYNVYDGLDQINTDVKFNYLNAGLLAGAFCCSDSHIRDRATADILSLSDNDELFLNILEKISINNKYSNIFDNYLIAYIESKNKNHVRQAIRIGGLVSINYLYDKFEKIADDVKLYKPLIRAVSGNQIKLEALFKRLHGLNDILHSRKEYALCKIAGYIETKIIQTILVLMSSSVGLLNRYFLYESFRKVVIRDGLIVSKSEVYRLISDEVKTGISKQTFLLRLKNLNLDYQVHDLLINSFQSEIALHKRFVFQLLSVLYNPNTIMKIENEFFYRHSNRQALAIESLESLLASDLKKEIIPFIEGTNPNEVGNHFDLTSSVDLINHLDKFLSETDISPLTVLLIERIIEK